MNSRILSFLSNNKKAENYYDLYHRISNVQNQLDAYARSSAKLNPTKPQQLQKELDFLKPKLKDAEIKAKREDLNLKTLLKNKKSEEALLLKQKDIVHQETSMNAQVGGRLNLMG